MGPLAEGHRERRRGRADAGRLPAGPDRPGRALRRAARALGDRATWPSPDVEVRTIPFAGEGVIRGLQACGLDSGAWCADGASDDLPPDQRAEDGMSFCVEGEPLDRGRGAARIRARVVHRHLRRAARAGGGAALRRRAGRRLAAGDARHAEPRPARVTGRARAAGTGARGARHDHARRHRPPVRRRPAAAARLLADLLAARLALAAGRDARDLRRRAGATGADPHRRGRPAVRAAAVPAEARGRNR